MKNDVHFQKTEPSRLLSALHLGVVTQDFQVVLSASEHRSGSKGHRGLMGDELSLPAYTLTLVIEAADLKLKQCLPLCLLRTEAVIFLNTPGLLHTPHIPGLLVSWAPNIF